MVGYFSETRSLRAQVWINYLLTLTGLSAEEFELTVFSPGKLEKTGVVRRWQTGSVPRYETVLNCAQKYPSSKEIFYSIFWDLIDTRFTCGKGIRNELDKNVGVNYYFFLALFFMRKEKIKDNPQSHRQYAEIVYRLLPFYLSEHNECDSFRNEIVNAIYHVTREFDTTASTLYPNFELCSRYADDIQNYDLTVSEIPQIQTYDFFHSLSENEQNYLLKEKPKSAYRNDTFLTEFLKFAQIKIPV